ncbi:MAG: hypothetical protein IT306_14705 [Chloroflexi bacterium]|nr:hypothetical protein [Chloroflexota bacterium]
MKDLTLIRKGHTEVGCGICGLCADDWPCDTAVVLDVLTETEQRAEAAEGREARLRGALAIYADPENWSRNEHGVMYGAGGADDPSVYARAALAADATEPALEFTPEEREALERAP